MAKSEYRVSLSRATVFSHRSIGKSDFSQLTRPLIDSIM